jgi:hypothetical protein
MYRSASLPVCVSEDIMKFSGEGFRVLVVGSGDISWLSRGDSLEPGPWNAIVLLRRECAVSAAENIMPASSLLMVARPIGKELLR